MSWWMWLLIAAGVLVIAYFSWASEWDGEVILMTSLVTVLAVGLAVGIPLAISSDDEWAAWCQSQGGHVDSSSQTVTTIGAGGKPAFGVSTTYYCLTDDGRLLGVR